MPEDIPPTVPHNQPAQKESPQGPEPNPKQAPPTKSVDVTTDTVSPAIHRKNKRYYPSENPWITWFTGIVAIAAILQFYVTCKQWNVMDETMRKAERAWVTVKEGQLDAALGQDVHIPTSWIIQNTGHSPARILSISHSVYTSPTLPVGRLADAPIRKLETKGVLGPETEWTIGTKFDIELPQSDFVAIRNKAGFVISAGKITYLDIFDSQHATTFCFILADPNSTRFSPCNNDWNNAD